MLGWFASTAMAGSFCLFSENGVTGLPFVTNTSPPWATAAGTAGMTIRAPTAATTNTAKRLTQTPPFLFVPQPPVGP